MVKLALTKSQNLHNLLHNRLITQYALKMLHNYRFFYCALIEGLIYVVLLLS